MKYQWSDGSRISGVTAEVAAQELESIRDRNGKVEPEIVVEEATPADAPLHPAFEWNDSKAAHEYRLDQARHICRAIVVIQDEEEAEPVRLMVHIPARDDQKGYYQSTEVAVDNYDEWTLATKELSRQANGLMRTLETMQRLARKRDKVTQKKVTMATAAIRKASERVAQITA